MRMIPSEHPPTTMNAPGGGGAPLRGSVVLVTKESKKSGSNLGGPQ